MYGAGWEYAQGLGWRGGLRGLLTSLSVVLRAAGQEQYSTFASSTPFLLLVPQKWQLDFFSLFCLFGQEFAPMAHAHSYF